MMYGISELQEVYTLWKKNKGNCIEKFAVSFLSKSTKQPLIFVGLTSVTNYLGKKIFKDEEISYLHSLQKDDGKLLFSDKFIKYLSLVTYDLYMEAPREGAVIFPGQPVLKITGNILILTFFKKIINHYFPRQIQIATEVEKIVSYVAPSFVSIENCSTSYNLETALDARSAYIGGAVATEDLFAAVRYNIPICYHDDSSSLVFLDVGDPKFTKKLSAVEGDQKIFLRGSITKEFLEEFPFYAVELKGISLDLSGFSEPTVTTRLHSYRNAEILDTDFRVYRFSYKGLAVGDILTSSDQIDKKKTFFGKYLTNLTKVNLLQDVTTYEEESAAITRNRALRSMQQLPCKFRGEESGKFYPVRILRKEQNHENNESFSNTRFA